MSCTAAAAASTLFVLRHLGAACLLLGRKFTASVFLEGGRMAAGSTLQLVQLSKVFKSRLEVFLLTVTKCYKQCS
jgi:hypothetical protein